MPKSSRVTVCYKVLAIYINMLYGLVENYHSLVIPFVKAIIMKSNYIKRSMILRRIFCVAATAIFTTAKSASGKLTDEHSMTDQEFYNSHKDQFNWGLAQIRAKACGA